VYSQRDLSNATKLKKCEDRNTEAKTAATFEPQRTHLLLMNAAQTAATNAGKMSCATATILGPNA
jgi:hypothetical protein